MAKPSFFSPCDLAIALATIPTLAGLVAMKSLGDMLIDLGLTSEEVFRGDRLPILNMPNMSSSSETPE